MIALLSFSERGSRLSERIALHFSERGEQVVSERCAKGELSLWTQRYFSSTRALIFVGATGIAVRAIAPLIQKKTIDPAVVVIDEEGRYCIPLLSGHLGGANALASDLARLLGSQAIITTATDLQGAFAVDNWAKEQGLYIANPEGIVGVSSAALAGKSIRILSDIPVLGDLPKQVRLVTEGDCEVHITVGRPKKGTLHLIPKVFALGVGCRKGMEVEKIEEAYEKLVRSSGIHPSSIYGLFSVDLKKDEPGLLEFAKRKNLPFQTFAPSELMEAKGEFYTSAFVASTTGADNVSERSAVLGAGAGAVLAFPRMVYAGVTMALAKGPEYIEFEGEE